MNEVQVKVEGLKGNEVVVRQGDAERIFQYKGFSYAAYSTDSLIALVKSKGSAANSVIAYDEKGVKVILDDTVIDREQSRIGYGFRKSSQFEEWEEVLAGAAVDQKSFIKFLQRREEGEVAEIEALMAALQNFKFVTNIAGDFTFDDRNNYTFAYKIGDAEGTVRFPQMLIANIEIFNESGLIQPMEIEIEVIKPRNESEKPVFCLSCPKLERYKRQAVDNEIDKIKTELAGHLIVTGNI